MSQMNVMGLMMQLMPLISTLSSSKISLKDVLEGRGAGAAVRSQILLSLPGNPSAKQTILEVLQRAEEMSKLRKTTLIDILIGSSSDPVIGDLLKKGIKSL